MSRHSGPESGDERLERGVETIMFRIRATCNLCFGANVIVRPSDYRTGRKANSISAKTFDKTAIAEFNGARRPYSVSELDGSETGLRRGEGANWGGALRR